MGSDSLLIAMVGIKVRFTVESAFRRITVLLVTVLLQAVPAFAQVDLAGTWVRSSGSDNGAAREQIDLLGIPVSADGRAKALSYDIGSLSATERQCQMYPPIYAFTGPFPLQISIEQDPITQRLLAWKIAGWGDRDATTIRIVWIATLLAR